MAYMSASDARSKPYRLAIPGMRESIRDGMKEPLSKSLKKDVDAL